MCGGGSSGPDFRMIGIFLYDNFEEFPEEFKEIIHSKFKEIIASTPDDFNDFCDWEEFSDETYDDFSDNLDDILTDVIEESGLNIEFWNDLESICIGLNVENFPKDKTIEQIRIEVEEKLNSLHLLEDEISNEVKFIDTDYTGFEDPISFNMLGIKLSRYFSDISEGCEKKCDQILRIAEKN